jgi:hypothetical protein
MKRSKQYPVYSSLAKGSGGGGGDNTEFIKTIERPAGADVTITIPNGTTKIGVRTFMDFQNLVGVTIPNTVTVIDQYSFSSCIGLASISANNVTSINAGAFYNCKKLVSADFPNVTRIESLSTFAFCENLTTLNIPNLTTFAYVSNPSTGLFSNCSKLVLTQLPSGLTGEIPKNCFVGCSKLALTSIPAGVTYIWQTAFQNCTGLTELTFLGKPITIDSTAFKGCTNLTTIRVPWSSGAVSNAPWGATNASVIYSYQP